MCDCFLMICLLWILLCGLHCKVFVLWLVVCLGMFHVEHLSYLFLWLVMVMVSWKFIQLLGKKSIYANKWKIRKNMPSSLSFVIPGN